MASSSPSPLQGVCDPALEVAVTASRPLSCVSAGSALLTIGDLLLVVGDDAHAVTWVDPTTGACTTQSLHGAGLPMPKHEKPDFEAAAVAPDGRVRIFGSGSLPRRRLTATLSGRGQADVALHHAPPLYDACAEQLGDTLNIEGAVYVGQTLQLFHRGVGDEPDVWFVLEEQAVRASREIRLGRLAGVGLHLTDVAADGSGAIFLLGAAEDTLDPVADGAVAGSVLGVIDADRVRWAPLGGRPRKAEGLVVDRDGRGGYLVTDSDDPGTSAELCRFQLSGPW